METLTNFFLNHGTARTYQPGQIICFQGDSSENVYLITKGFVKIYDINIQGNEQMVSIFSERNVFPLTWLLARDPKAVLYNYEAISEVECRALSREHIRQFIANRPEILMILLDMVTKAYINNVGRIAALQRTNIRERVEFVLFYLAHRLGKPDEKQPGVCKIGANITLSDIAKLAGVTRESVSREINKPGMVKLFWRHDGQTYINIAKLKSDTFPVIVV